MEEVAQINHLDSKESSKRFKARLYSALGRIMLGVSRQKEQEAARARRRKNRLKVS